MYRCNQCPNLVPIQLPLDGPPPDFCSIECENLALEELHAALSPALPDDPFPTIIFPAPRTHRPKETA